MKKEPNIDGRPAIAWVICSKCNNARHRIFPGEETPYWWCQDEMRCLSAGQEIEVEYIEKLVEEHK